MTRRIKKYKNRRLYDMAKSRYITIDTLRAYVLDGIEFRVEDATSGEDLTSHTLLQILVDMQTGTAGLLAPQLLSQLIRLLHHPMQQQLQETLNRSMETMGALLKQQSLAATPEQLSALWGEAIDAWKSGWERYFRK